MNRKVRVSFMLILLLGIVSLWGCPKKTEVTTSPETQKENIAAQQAPAAPSNESKATEAKPEGPVEKATSTAEGLKPVYFDFDKSFIRDEAKTIMQANAEWLKANPKAKIKIEGNCDERGTIEYNQALGQRRALSAKKYLTDLGISGHRISLISYGKEKPICSEHEESCWQKNRRDDFVVLTE
jgi:peptidoglycan-associated lipoprotein